MLDLIRIGDRCYFLGLIPGSDPLDVDTGKYGIRLHEGLKALPARMGHKTVLLEGKKRVYRVNRHSAEDWVQRHGGELTGDLPRDVQDTYELVVPLLQNGNDGLLDLSRDRKLMSFTLHKGNILSQLDRGWIAINPERIPLKAPGISLPEGVEFDAELFMNYVEKILGKSPNWNEYERRLQVTVRDAVDNVLAVYLAGITQCLADESVGNDIKEAALLPFAAQSSCYGGMVTRVQRAYAKLLGESALTDLLRAIEDYKEDVLALVATKVGCGNQSVHFVSGCNAHLGDKLGLDQEAGLRDCYNDFYHLSDDPIIRYRAKRGFYRHYHARDMVDRLIDKVNSNKDSNGRIQGLDVYFDAIRNLLMRRYEDFQKSCVEDLGKGTLKKQVAEFLNDPMLARAIRNKEGTTDPEKLRFAAFDEFLTEHFFSVDEDDLVCGLKPLAMVFLLIEMGVLEDKRVFWHKI